jgi:hypothetical protein
MMNPRSLSGHGGLLAAIGALFVTPAVLVCLAGPLNLSASSPLIHPVLVLGGLAAAFLLNLLAVLDVKVRIGEGILLAEMKVEQGWMNLLIASLTFGVALALMAYAFAENFGVIPR